MAEVQQLTAAAAFLRPGQNKIFKWAEAAQNADAGNADLIAEHVSVGLFDPKGELLKALNGLRRTAISKLPKADRITRGDTMIAAHTVFVALALFTEVASGNWAREDLYLRDADIWKLLNKCPADLEQAAATYMIAQPIPVPSPTERWTEFLGRMLQMYSDAGEQVAECIKLVTSSENDTSGFESFYRYLTSHVLPLNALMRYSKYLIGAVEKSPEFAIWTLLRDDEPDRPAPWPQTAQWLSDTEVNIPDVLKHLRGRGTGLAGLQAVLKLTCDGGAAPDEWTELARLYEHEIAHEIGDSAPGVPRHPALRDSYINPAYCATSYDPQQDLPHEETWWNDLDVHDEIQGFIARYLATPSATTLPLLLLGHPGAGKSVFTRVLAAQLGALDRPVVRVDLRGVAADAPIYRQLSSAIEKALSRRIEWSTLAQRSRNEIPVVILDGLDELIQSSAVSRADYLELVREFQRGEAARGYPVIVIVTSRTIVAQRVRIPPETVIVRLEPFDDKRIALWLKKWNQHNTNYFAASGKQPLTLRTVLTHRGLAIQPLLLFMLALYDSADNTLQREGENFVGADLYERLLRLFADRELRKQFPNAQDDELEQLVEKELETLSVAAFAMFNRGSQAVLEDELAADLDAFTGSAGQRVRQSTRLDNARKLVSRFFFVHVSQATSVNGVEETTKSAYEFLHATFGEYLVARLTYRAIMHTYESARPNNHALNMMGTEPDYSVMGALLSFELLCTRNTVTAFLRHAADRTDPKMLRTLVDLLADALRNTLFVDEWGSLEGYSPRRTTIPVRLSLRTANLLLLAVIFGVKTTPAALFPDSENSEAEWTKLAALWRATLPSKSWQLLTDTLEVIPADDGGSLSIRARNASPAENIYALSPSLEEMRRLNLLVHDSEVQWALSTLIPLMHAAPLAHQPSDAQRHGATLLTHLAFPTEVDGVSVNDNARSLMAAAADYAKILEPKPRVVFLSHLVRLISGMPGPLPSSLMANIALSVESPDSTLKQALAGMLFEAVRPDYPLPENIDELRESLCQITAHLGSHDFGSWQAPIAIGLARLGIPDRNLPSRLCILPILRDPQSAWQRMERDPHLVARLIQVIRVTSRRKSARRAVHLLELIPDLNPLVFYDLDIQFVLTHARQESPDATARLQNRWYRAVRNHENWRILRVLQQSLARRSALTQVASVLQAAIDGRQ